MLVSLALGIGAMFGGTTFQHRLSSAGMAMDAWVQPSRVMMQYFVAIAGLSLVSIGRWKVSKTDYHNGVMMMHLFIGMEASATALIFIIRASLHGDAMYDAASSGKSAPVACELEDA